MLNICNEQSLVSIIIPVYQVDEFIVECLNSICNQTYKNLEIIIINDGSTDNSGLICDFYRDKDDRIKVIHQENHGVSYTRNKGIGIANGEFIIFIDPDDILKDIHVEFLVKILLNSKVELVFSSYTSDYDIFINDVQHMEESKIIDSMTVFERMLDDKKFDGYLWNKVFISKTIKENQIVFDERLSIYEDLLFVCHYLKCIKKVAFIENILYFYRIRGDSAVSNIDSRKVKEKCIAIRMIWELTEEKSSRVYDIAKQIWIKYTVDYLFMVRKNNLLKKEIEDFNIVSGERNIMSWKTYIKFCLIAIYRLRKGDKKSEN